MENLRPGGGPWVTDNVFSRMVFLGCGSWSSLYEATASRELDEQQFSDCWLASDGI